MTRSEKLFCHSGLAIEDGFMPSISETVLKLVSRITKQALAKMTPEISKLENWSIYVFKLSDFVLCFVRKCVK